MAMPFLTDVPGSCQRRAEGRFLLSGITFAMENSTVLTAFPLKNPLGPGLVVLLSVLQEEETAGAPCF